MKKLYYHGAVVIEEGCSVCSTCGADIDDTLLSTKPCSIPTAYYVVFDELPEFKDIYWVINVSNCRATLLAGKCVPGGMRYSKVTIKDKYLQEQIEDILLASVEENGGTRNISGLYGISDDLAHVLKGWLTDGKIAPEVYCRQKDIGYLNCSTVPGNNFQSCSNGSEYGDKNCKQSCKS